MDKCTNKRYDVLVVDDDSDVTLDLHKKKRKEMKREESQYFGFARPLVNCSPCTGEESSKKEKKGKKREATEPA